ncbi:peroxisomal docking protein Pex14 [Schizosaccharomyces cryophilus OY26]|uniref:Peroxisomal membrane protein PEX14 n=1 Tax=Schizosaccharomyces cryophilus (strain OY26 / ATCC MYA-4695 / CBS 11777 / NBRC 106824 / NRRL Y48691) TaxID=653667 RepID=S9X913_SCHCR|nr:peroxisomal docking protein Pex14 [Schizosaccharomyces cryophilus OY26]EPY53687.1 peroxisomal docking protein Pex14 [Schizosaccharomyces cryophilus OY26]
MKQELIKDAVEFLRQDSIMNAPDSEKAKFLGSKGLNQDEIQNAFALAQSPLYNTMENYSNSENTLTRDWRDWFIMGVISGGFAWSAYTLVKKYVVPMLEPPSRSAYEEDKDALDRRFEEAERTLDSLSETTKKLEERSEKNQDDLDAALDDLEETLSTLRRNSDQRDRDIARISQDVYTMSAKTLPESLERIQKSQEEALKKLAEEVKQLQSLQQNHQSSTGELSGTPAFIDKGGQQPNLEKTSNEEEATSPLPDWQLSMHAQATDDVDFS